MGKRVWVLVKKGSKCLGHGDGNAATYELATDSIWGGALYPAFVTAEAAMAWVDSLGSVFNIGLSVTPLEVLGDD